MRPTRAEQIRTARMIVQINASIDKAKQRTIKKILRRLNKMSPNDIQTLARILNA